MNTPLRRIVVAALGLGWSTIGSSQPVELPQPVVVGSSRPAFSAVIQMTNQAPARIPVGTPTASASSPALWVDGLSLYKVGNCSRCQFGLLPSLIALKQGQTLDVTLENLLNPAQTSTPEAASSNLHTHGLITPIHAQSQPATTGCQVQGDSVFALSRPHNPAAACRELSQHPMGQSTMYHVQGPLRYRYRIAADHPSGLYWYHPHPHGHSEEQVAGGLSGLMTVGQFWDSAFIRCAPPRSQAEREHPERRCVGSARLKEELSARLLVQERFLQLKDIQIAEHSQGRYHLSPVYNKALCAPPQTPTAFDTRKGSCRGLLAQDQPNSLWAFPVNGVLYPTLTVTQGTAQVWRIANSSPDVTYRLQLVVTSAGATRPVGSALPLRVLAQDGATLPSTTRATDQPLEIVLMPSARTELLIDPCEMGLGFNSEGRCRLLNPIQAELRTLGADVGATAGSADVWPAVALAHVKFDPSANELGQSESPISTVGPLISPSQPIAFQPIDAFIDPISATRATPPPTCQPTLLQPNQVRVIRFKNGMLTDDEEHFGLRAEISTASLSPDRKQIRLGSLVDRPLTDYYAMSDPDPAHSASLCIKSGVTERWVLVNDSEECHNFHIHQLRFKVLAIQDGHTPADQNCLGNRERSVADDVWHDNFPLPPHARVMLEMPFNRPEQIGKFVYHCHILEHEDKGMMATVEVVK